MTAVEDMLVEFERLVLSDASISRLCVGHPPMVRSTYNRISNVGCFYVAILDKHGIWCSAMHPTKI